MIARSNKSGSSLGLNDHSCDCIRQTGSYEVSPIHHHAAVEASTHVAKRLSRRPAGQGVEGMDVRSQQGGRNRFAIKTINSHATKLERERLSSLSW